MKSSFPKELITGINKIDIQHMELMARIKELYESYTNGTNVEKVLEVMKYLRCYVDEHFATEEKFMIEHNYPNVKRHVAAHRSFVSDFTEMEKDFAINGYSTDLNLDFNVKIINWMNSHVMQEDKLLADFLKKCETCHKQDSQGINII